MTFSEACFYYQLGHSIKRKSWPNNKFLQKYMDNEELLIGLSDMQNDDWTICYPSIENNDKSSEPISNSTCQIRIEYCDDHQGKYYSIKYKRKDCDNFYPFGICRDKSDIPFIIKHTIKYHEKINDL